MKAGIVVIGRNEGERLVACLSSLPMGKYPVLYVDSGSSDGSVQKAVDMRADVVALDMSVPFTAGRARNEGQGKIAQNYPSVEYIQFLDGDCMLCDNWLAAAVEALDGNESLAAVFGRIEEMNPEKSIYNRLCALEWQSPSGRIENCGAFGGNSMIRLKAFVEVGGFNNQVIAGEDAELAARMLLANYRIEKLDLPMVQHDADITRFAQWWLRSVRSGHAIGQRAYIHGNSLLKDCLRERRSLIIWGMVLPLLLLAGLLISVWLGAAIAALYGVLAFRIWRYRQRNGNSSGDAAIYAGFTVLGKLPEALGLLRFWRNHFAQRFQIIEYK